MELSEQFKSKALDELREDDSRRQQALQQFREWISKQSHITNCRTGLTSVATKLKLLLDFSFQFISDDSFLLRFLRVKKYSNADAFKMLEKFLVSCETHPNWFRNLTFDDDRVRELFDKGYIFPLKERDENGCRVVVIRSNVIDPKKFTFSDELMMINLTIFTLLEEPETQIAGFVFIIDHKDIAFDYIAGISLSDIRNYLKCIQSAIPSRPKKAIFLNVPGFAVALLDFAKTLISSKLKERAQFFKDSESVFKYVDKKILPKEYGGSDLTIQDMMNNFRSINDCHKQKLFESDRQRINLAMVKGQADEAIGSFRKLEID